MKDNDNITVVWPGNTFTPVIGRPECGWDGEFCEKGNSLLKEH